MLKLNGAVRAPATTIGRVADRVIEAYRGDRAPYEDDITGRLLGGIEDSLDGKTIKGITWQAKKFKTGRGSAAEEKKTGADFMGVLDIEIEGYSVKKGFLVQAKRAEPGCRLGDWKRLTVQAENMLKITPDSFVFIYSKQRGIRVFPAISVLGLKSKDIFELYDRSITRFFEEHFQCFIGDMRLNSPRIETIDHLAEMQMPYVLHLQARTDNERFYYERRIIT